MMTVSLISVFKAAPEFRGQRGQRYELWFILLLLVMAALCGYWGYRPAAEFAERYGPEIRQTLALPALKEMPSYSTFRRVMLGLDFTQFAELFNRWATQYVAIEPGEWVAVDGKSIRGSVTGYNKAEQNFIMLVSVFSQKRGVVIHAQPMENKYNSEEHVVQAMLAALDLNGAVVTLDALHTKKKR